MRYYIIAGEASGDLHGSNLMKGIYAEDPEAEIRFWGGDLMLGTWGMEKNRATPLAAGGGAHEVGGVVLKTIPYRFHQVAAPKADVSLRVFGIYALHQIGTVEVSGSFA